MAKKGISIKTKILITLFLLPFISISVVGVIAILQNRDNLTRQAEINMTRLINEMTNRYNESLIRIQKEMEAASDYASIAYAQDRLKSAPDRRMLMPWTGEGYGNPQLNAELLDDRLYMEKVGVFLQVIVSQNPFLTLGYYASESGITVFDNEDVVDVILQLEGFDPRKRPWYVSAFQEGEAIWTVPYVDANTKKLVVTTAKPVFSSEGDIIGVVGFDVLLETLQEDILNTDIGYSNYAFMINGEADVLVSPAELIGTGQKWNEEYSPDNLLDTDNEEFKNIILDMITGASGYSLFSPGSGETNYLVYAPIDLLDSSVGVVVPQEEIVRRPIEESGKLLIISLAVITIVVLGVGIVLGNQITRPIENLTRMVDKASRGLVEVQQIRIERKDEIGSLAESFNRMIKNMSIVLQELEQKKEEL